LGAILLSLKGEFSRKHTEEKEEKKAVRGKEISSSYFIKSKQIPANVRARRRGVQEARFKT